MMARTVIIAVAALFASCFNFSAQFLQPRRTTEYVLPGNDIPADNLDELEIEVAPDLTLVAMWAQQDQTAGATTVMFLHDLSGNIDDYWEKWVTVLWGRGYNVFIVDYGGYGKSTGTLTSATGLYDDAEAALDFLMQLPAVGDSPVIVWGYGLGSSIAAELVLRQSADALVLEASHTSLRRLIENGSPYRIPAAWLTSAELDTLARMPAVDTPLVIAHGRDDVVAPLRMGAKNHDAAPGPKRMVIVENAEHNDTLLRGARDIDEALRQLGL